MLTIAVTEATAASTVGSIGMPFVVARVVVAWVEIHTVRVATPADLERAERAVKLIAARGYSRSRALVVELNALVDPSAPSSSRES